MNVSLYGYAYSVYTWIVRATLAEKGVAYDYVEINPFQKNVNETYLELHPFKRVPVLRHGDFTLYETSAITRYIDDAFDGNDLQPANAKELGRMAQIISIIDAYGFEPMMRQAFTNKVVCKKFDLPVDQAAFDNAMIESKTVLTAINRLVSNSAFICGEHLSLADLHLAPVIEHFQQFDEGREMLLEFDKISHWYSLIHKRQSLQSTRPKQ